MTGDKRGERGGFDQSGETNLSLPQIPFNIKDMGAQKASEGLNFVSLGEGVF